MKSFIIVSLICTSSFFSAKSIDSIEEKIQGNWYSCRSEDNYYLEMYFLNDSMAISYDLLLGIEYKKYKVLTDSLLLYTDYWETIFWIEFINDDNFLLITDTLKYEFSKISEELKIGVGDNSFILEEKDLDDIHSGVLKRMKLNCSL